jgi:signal transduction histidine kinase
VTIRVHRIQSTLLRAGRVAEDALPVGLGVVVAILFLVPGLPAVPGGGAGKLAVAATMLLLVVRQTVALRQRNEAEARLIEASKQQAVGELATSVAHEVNNPLTAVLGNAELLLADLPPDSPQREELQTIRDEALRARDIVRALLELAHGAPAARED